MKLRAALLGAAAACAMPVVAQAQEFVQGPYVGLSGGWSWTQDIELESRGFRNEIDFKDGITVLGEAGFRTSLGIRPALEVGWTRSTVGDIAGGAFGRAGGNGKVNALTVMGALYYDLNAIGPVRPYVGAGVGVADVKFKRVGDLFASGLSISERDRAVAWQVGAGVNAAVSENLDLTVGYRFLDTGIVRYNKVTDTVFDYQTHTVLVGLRYTFGAPAAAPRAAEPAAAPVAAPPPPPPPPP
ncbi:MAG TPA: outer membrane beta-barrel protein, partial [Azospirillaceae bacterium]|nr:outer membrane beta-barrel protein [Azospirillaceae bacterium]